MKYKLILFFTINIIGMNLLNAQANEVSMKRGSTVEILDKSRAINMDTYLLNGKLMLPIEAVWSELSRWDEVPAYEKETNFITLRRPDRVYELEDSFPTIKINLNKPEFISRDKTYRFDALQIIDEKIFVSADFFLKAYNWLVAFGTDVSDRWRYVKLGATCDLKGATALMMKGSTLGIKLKVTPEHKWEFSINPQKGISRDERFTPIVEVEHVMRVWEATVTLTGETAEPFRERDIYETSQTYSFIAKKTGNYTITVENGIDSYTYMIAVY